MLTSSATSFTCQLAYSATALGSKQLEAYVYHGSQPVSAARDVNAYATVTYTPDAAHTPTITAISSSTLVRPDM